MATRQPISSISTTNIWIEALQTLNLTTKILRILRRSEELMFQIRERQFGAHNDLKKMDFYDF